MRTTALLHGMEGLPMRYGMAALWVMAAMIAAPRAHAIGLSEDMPCSRLVAIMNGHNQGKVRQSGATILTIMGKIDSAHIEHGNLGIMDQLNRQGELAVAELTSDHCREHPNMTIFNSAAYVYGGIRGLLVQIGTAK